VSHIDARARDVLERTIAAYRRAATYRDRGVRVDMTRHDTSRIRTTPCTIAIARAGRCRVVEAEAAVVWDGATRVVQPRAAGYSLRQPATVRATHPALCPVTADPEAVYPCGLEGPAVVRHPAVLLLTLMFDPDPLAAVQRGIESVAHARQELDDGVPCDVLELRPLGVIEGRAPKLWIDAKTGLVRRLIALRDADLMVNLHRETAEPDSVVFRQLDAQLDAEVPPVEISRVEEIPAAAPAEVEGLKAVWSRPPASPVRGALMAVEGASVIELDGTGRVTGRFAVPPGSRRACAAGNVIALAHGTRVVAVDRSAARTWSYDAGERVDALDAAPWGWVVGTRRVHALDAGGGLRWKVLEGPLLAGRSGALVGGADAVRLLDREGAVTREVAAKECACAVLVGERVVAGGAGTVTAMGPAGEVCWTAATLDLEGEERQRHLRERHWHFSEVDECGGRLDHLVRPRQIEVGDVNGDGADEIVVVTETGALSVFDRDGRRLAFGIIGRAPEIAVGTWGILASSQGRGLELLRI
jgi:hypothetical protein